VSTVQRISFTVSVAQNRHTSMTTPNRDAHDALNRPRRFWKEVSVAPEGAGFAVKLDGRTPKTPAGRRLVLPTEALARLVADEWAAQGEWVVHASMPATRLAFTAVDRIPETREAVAAEVAKYAGSDLLCYFADTPKELLEREVERWGPVLDWAERDLGLHFNRVTGIVHQEQPAETVGRVRALALEADDFALAGLSWLTALLGSAVLALAVRYGELDGDAAFELSRLDEAFQMERWGEDAEALERNAALRADAVLIGRWLDAL
jgi:chaperone required for assembly of F1-ATPase